MGRRRSPSPRQGRLALRLAAALLGVVAADAGCDSGGNGVMVGDAGDDSAVAGDGDPNEFACPVLAPTSCPTPPVRYADIKPTVDEHCVPCHMGQPNGPWPLTDYSHLVDWQDLIQGVMMDCSMPPIDEPYSLPARDRALILTWVLCGYPE
jgi:hypothetical protein